MSAVAAPADASILSPEALAFVERLERELGPARGELLERRRARHGRPDFLDETREVREADWTVAPAPPDLRDRRCEITGPVDRKMMINALNSGARVFMADFEDACSPTWTNVVEGQANLRDAVRGTIRLETPEKTYALGEETATLIVRPRGWHLHERHVLVDGEPVSASLFDFGLAFFHNAREQLEPLHRARRDDPRRVRDGRDPPRAARVRLRAERRPLGLHLQRDQEARRRTPRPGAGDDGRAVHAGLHAAPLEDVPQPRRARDRRHGCVHP